jgi:hypothetical protein
VISGSSEDTTFKISPTFSHVLSIFHVGDSFVRRAVTLSQHAAFPIGGCDLEKEGPDGIYVSSFVEALFYDNT